MRRFPIQVLGILPLACCGGCAAVGGLAQTAVQIVQLALSLAAIVLPFAAWYYYNRHRT